MFVLQEEIEAQMKADKIKLALEKLKEAKVKKVRQLHHEGHCDDMIQPKHPGETNTADAKTLMRPEVQNC